MSQFASFDCLRRLEQLREERPIENDFVPRNVYDYNAERQRLQIMLVLESTIGGHEYMALKTLQEHVICQVLPAEIEKSLDIMVRKSFDQTRINTRVYYDAHSN